MGERTPTGVFRSGGCFIFNESIISYYKQLVAYDLTPLILRRPWIGSVGYNDYPKGKGSKG